MDANCGFWQSRLQKESALLTTFISSFGRFCFNRLWFSVTSAPEYFQKYMSVSSDCTIFMMDDVIIYGRNWEEHDFRLIAVLEHLQQANVTLNIDECKLSINCVRFLGHIVDGSGIHPHPQKLEATQMMPTSKPPSEVRRFLGMANQLGKFLPSLAEMSKSLWDLLSKKQHMELGWTTDESFPCYQEGAQF